MPPPSPESVSETRACRCRTRWPTRSPASRAIITPRNIRDDEPLVPHGMAVIVNTPSVVRFTAEDQSRAPSACGRIARRRRARRHARRSGRRARRTSRSADARDPPCPTASAASASAPPTCPPAAPPLEQRATRHRDRATRRTLPRSDGLLVNRELSFRRKPVRPATLAAPMWRRTVPKLLIQCLSELRTSPTIDRSSLA
jgi:hypothetical protein